ncbi:MAG: molybdenum cofactor biosynthesis protein MoaE, partial [Thiohalomonadales bacterium]
MATYLQDSLIEPWLALSDYQREMTHCTGQYGASNIFIGTMRDYNEGAGVSEMMLEHYPEMTRRHLEKIEHEARQEFDLLDSLIIHRFGAIHPNEPIVVVASWAAHRDAAFKASRFMIDALKQRAPFWKKETLVNSGESRWVTA